MLRLVEKTSAPPVLPLENALPLLKHALKCYKSSLKLLDETNQLLRQLNGRATPSPTSTAESRASTSGWQPSTTSGTGEPGNCRLNASSSCVTRQSSSR